MTEPVVEERLPGRSKVPSFRRLLHDRRAHHRPGGHGQKADESRWDRQDQPGVVDQVLQGVDHALEMAAPLEEIPQIEDEDDDPDEVEGLEGDRRLARVREEQPCRHAEQDGGQGAIQDKDEPQVRLLPEEEEQEGDDEADLQQDNHGLLLYAYPR